MSAQKPKVLKPPFACVVCGRKKVVWDKENSCSLCKAEVNCFGFRHIVKDVCARYPDGCEGCEQEFLCEARVFPSMYGGQRFEPESDKT